MAKKQNPNYELLLLAIDQLGELANDMVFVGGCATGLLITDAAAPPIRQTNDVDAIVQVASRAEYYQLSDRLRERGFAEDTRDGAPLCRWLTTEVTLDVMPTEAAILGFSNKWYAAAIENSEIVRLHDKAQIRLVSAPYFLMTKLEAFNGRGNNDYQLSHDMEDVIAVLDGRAEIINEIRKSDAVLVNALAERLQYFLKDSRFVDAVSGHMPTDSISQSRVPTILKKLNEIVAMNSSR